jgi:signal peptidase II
VPRVQEAGRAPVTLRRRIAFLAIATVVALADQITKRLALSLLEVEERVEVLGFFGWRLTFNTGGAFGVLSSFPQFFFIASLVIVAVVLFWGWRGRFSVVPLGLILGGGVGNLLDRLLRPPGPMRGRVVDFIDLTYWPTFNLADSAIVLGVGLLILTGLGEEK